MSEKSAQARLGDVEKQLGILRQQYAGPQGTAEWLAVLDRIECELGQLHAGAPTNCHPIQPQDEGNVAHLAVVARDITDRKQKGEEIAALAKFPSENPAPVLRFSAEGKLLYSNDASESLRSVWQDDPDGPIALQWRQIIQDSLTKGQPHQQEFECEGRVYSTTFAPVAEGQYVNVYAIDITERKQAEQSLRETKDQLEHRVRDRTADLATAIDELQIEVKDRIEAQRALAKANELLERMFSSIELMVAYMDRDFNFIRVNRAFAAEGGRDPEFYLGENHFVLYPDEKKKDIFRQAAETGEPYFAYETPFVRTSDDKYDRRYWDWSLQPVREADGRVGGLVLCMFDVTERIHAREEVVRQQRRLFSVLNMLPGFVVLIGRDCDIRFANHAYVELFGAISNKPCYEIMRGDRKLCQQCPVEQVLRTNQPIVQEWTSRLGRSYQIYAYPFSDVDGSQVVLKLGIDITERKALEKEVMEAGVKVRQRIGHDLHDSLGQKLTGIAFLSKALQQSLQKQNIPEAAEAAEIAKQVSASIAQTRSLARGLSPVSVKAHGLMDALRQYTQDTIDIYGISCVFDCDQHISVADRVVAIHVFRIAQEAVTNAIHHGRAKNITIHLAGKNGEVTLVVSDNGLGMSNKSQKDGMGLRIMSHRASAIGGSLEILDGSEGGTIVRCSFPESVSDEVT